HPQAAIRYTFLQTQARTKRMRLSRRPQSPQNMHDLAEILRPLECKLLLNISNSFNCLYQSRIDLEIVGIDGTYKTLPQVPMDLRYFLTFQILHKSVINLMIFILMLKSVVRYCHRKVNCVLNLVKRDDLAARIFRMVCIALPHLPTERDHPGCPNFCMEDGLNTIVNYTIQFPEINEVMNRFLMDYIYHYWFLQIGP
ncbi:MULE domain-containing protein, partial [Aphis craccivora]